MRIEGLLSFLLLTGFGLIHGCQSPFAQGQELYISACANCHMDDGSGLEGLIPPLNGSNLIISQPELLPCIVRMGMEGPILVNGVVYNQVMTPVSGLNDVELANVLNYIQYEWGDKNIFYSPTQIQRIVANCNEGTVHIKTEGME